jgi:hypothetical protein
MATKADFTNEEWLALRKGVMGSAMLVSMSDRDFTDTFGEAGAMAKFLQQQKLTGATGLIRELAQEGSPFGVTTPPDRLRNETMDSLRASVATLSQKSPDDVDAYRQLVLELAGAVASAKSGESPVEVTMISQIREAMGS